MVWVVGAILGGITVQPPSNPTADESWTPLIDADHMRLGVTCTHAVLVVTPPWKSEWRATIPLPGRRDRSRPGDASAASKSKPPAPHPVVVVRTGFLLALP